MILTALIIAIFLELVLFILLFDPHHKPISIPQEAFTEQWARHTQLGCEGRTRH
jgi:hypothetical protein